jgi:L-ascorbate metabolism protein UlaG (beta-lactamase superfamily)
MRTGLCLIAGAAFFLACCGCEKQKTQPQQETRQNEKEGTMSITVQWLGHASFRIASGSTVIYIDPWKLKQSARDANLVLVSHSHYDHYSASDIAKVRGPATQVVGPADVAGKEAEGRLIAPGQAIECDGIRITAVASYNPDKQFHPKKNSWVGFVIEIGGKRIYYAGDTDLTDEMKALKDIDLALLPVGGTYTMNADEAVQAVAHIKPKQAIPYHWGDIVGARRDADKFAKSAECKVTVLSPGDSISL